MNRAEYWILDSVAAAEFPLDALADEGRTVNTLNRRWHGLARGELLDALCGLFEGGRLAARRRGGAPFRPTRAEVSEALDFTPGRGREGDSAREAYYFLTPEGGALWESVARPDWSLYVYQWSDEAEAEIYARTRRAAEQSLALEPYRGRRVAPGTEVWERLKPWRATYWKTLDEGHRVRYRHAPEPGDEHTPPPPHLREWADQTSRWHAPYEEAVASHKLP